MISEAVPHGAVPAHVEAQEPSSMISEVREAVQANVEAHEPSPMISEAQEAASPDSEAPA